VTLGGGPLAGAGAAWHNPRMGKRGQNRGRIAVLLVFGAIATGIMTVPPVPAETATSIFECTNEASGARWSISIDFDRKTADSWPASITRRAISWHDRVDQGFYSLNRATGDLTILRASSTGGYEQHDACHLG